MAKHQDLTSPYAIHPFAYSSNADPASDASIDTTPYKGWINTGNSNLLKVRNAADSAWEDVSVAGAATAPAFGSNSASVTTYNDNAGTLAAANAHHHIGVTSLAHTSNTFTGPVTIVAGANIGITSSATGTYRIDGAAAGGGGGAAVTGQMNQLSGNVTMTLANTYYDGPSLSLGAGTYYLSGTVTVNGIDAAIEVTSKLWNGTTVGASTEGLAYGGAAGRKYSTHSLSCYVVLSGTETWKISCTGNGGAGAIILAAAVDNGAGNNASTLVAIKIA